MEDDLLDKDLLVAEDEHSAFSMLYNRYWLSLYNKALQRVDDADAQDLVQGVFISCWRNRHSIRVDDSLSPYLFTALKYAIIKHVYRKAKNGILLELSVQDLELTELTTEELLQCKELQSLINNEVAGLPKRMKEIYQLSRVEHMNVGDIAERLNISDQTVKNTLTSALKRLRHTLGRLACWIPFLF